MTRLKYKISPLIFWHIQANEISLESPTWFKLFPYSIQNSDYLSPTKQTQNSLASHVRLWLSVRKLLSHFYFQHWMNPTLWTHRIVLHFPKILSTLLQVFCYFFSKGYNLSSFLFQLISYLDLAWNATMDLEVWGDVWDLGNTSLGEILSFWIPVFQVGNKGSFSSLPTR